MTGAMRALVRERDGVALRSLPRPTIQADDDLLVRVRMAGVCRTDLLVAIGKIPVSPPRVLGHEACGVVEAAGSGVAAFRPGAYVALVPRIPCGVCAGCRALAACWAPSFLGLDRDGAFAEYVRVPARCALAVPETLSPRLAAYLEPVAAALAVTTTGIRTDDRGLVHGRNRIAGLVTSVLAAKGFRRPDSYDPHGGARLADNRYDFAVETGASTRVLDDLVRAVRPGGRIVLKSRLVEPVPLVLADVVRKDITLVAASYGSFDEAAALLASGALAVEPLLGDAAPLDAFARVFEAAGAPESRKLFFRVEA